MSLNRKLIGFTFLLCLWSSFVIGGAVGLYQNMYGNTTLSIKDDETYDYNTHTFVTRPKTIDVRSSAYTRNADIVSTYNYNFWHDLDIADQKIPAGYPTPAYFNYLPSNQTPETSVGSALNILKESGNFRLDPVILPQGFSPQLYGPSLQWMTENGQYGDTYDPDVDSAILSSIRSSHYENAWMGEIGDEDTTYQIIFPVDDRLDIQQIGVSFGEKYAVYVPWGSTEYSVYNDDWIKGCQWSPMLYENTAQPNNIYSYFGWHDAYTYNQPFMMMPTENVLADRIYFYRIQYSNDYYNWYDLDESLYSSKPTTEWDNYWNDGKLFYHNGYENRRYFEQREPDNYLPSNYQPRGTTLNVYNKDSFHFYDMWTGQQAGYTVNEYNLNSNKADIILPPSHNDYSPSLLWNEFNPTEDIPIKYIQIRIEKILYTRGSMFGLGRTAENKYQGVPEIADIFIEYAINDPATDDEQFFMDASIASPRPNAMYQVSPFGTIPLEFSYYMIADQMQMISTTTGWSPSTFSPLDYTNDFYFYINGKTDKKYTLLGNPPAITRTILDPEDQDNNWLPIEWISDTETEGYYNQYPHRSDNTMGFTFTTASGFGGLYDITFQTKDIGMTTIPSTDYTRENWDNTDGYDFPRSDFYENIVNAQVETIEGDAMLSLNPISPDFVSAYQFHEKNNLMINATWEKGVAMEFTMRNAGFDQVQTEYINPITFAPESIIQNIPTVLDDWVGISFNVTLYRIVKNIDGEINYYSEEEQRIVIPLSGSWDDNATMWLRGSEYVDLNTDLYLDVNDNTFKTDLNDQQDYQFRIPNLGMVASYLYAEHDLLFDTDYGGYYDFGISNITIFTIDGLFDSQNINDYVYVDSVRLIQYPLLDNIFNRFQLEQQVGSTWKVVSEYSPALNDVYLTSGQINPLYQFSDSVFHFDWEQFTEATESYYGQVCNYTFSNILIDPATTYNYRVRWITSYHHAGNTFDTSLYQNIPYYNSFQFGNVYIQDIQLQATQLEKQWASYNPYDLLLTPTKEMQKNEALFTKAVVLRNAFVSADHSPDYTIDTYTNNIGEFPHIYSATPTTNSYIEIKVNFPVSAYYDLCLRDSSPLDRYDKNRYALYVDGELYRIYNQYSTPQEGSLYNINFNTIQESYPSLPHNSYEGFDQFPLQVANTSSQLYNRDALSPNELLRVASDFFTAGEHTIRIQFDKKISDDDFSLLRYDQIVLFYQSIRGFQIPISNFEQSTDPMLGDTYNITVFMNSSLVGSAENPNHIEAKNETISFQLYAKPYINFNGGYLPDIYEYKIDSRKGIQQNQYLKQGDKVIIDVLMADTDFDVSRLAYRINGALTWTTILPINIESLDSVNLLYRFTKDITGEFGILQGKNIVEIRGYDQRNHETTSVLVFYYDTTPPQLTINDITNIGIGNTIGAESPVITFTINDGQFGQIQSTGWYVPRLATYFQSGFVSLQNQTTFLFDFDLNLTKITESTFTCTIDKSFLKYGANTIYFFVKDRSNNVNIVPISLYRNGSFTTFEFNDFEWRYVNEPVPLSVTAKQYIAYENNGQTWYNTITASRDKTLRLGISDVLTYEQIEQEFVATSNTLTTVGIRAFTEYKLLRFPILVEVLDTRNNVLSSGYVYPQSSEATSSRSSADIPDIVLTVGEIYKIRITPQEAGYNFYRVSYVPNPIPTENLGGQLYGYIRGIKIPIQGQIWLRLSGGSIEYLGTAGQIQYKVNNGALSPIYYNGVCEAIIESSIQGINVVTVNVALDFGLIYQNNITYFWVTPNTHTTPQITYYSPEINKIYQKELGVHYTYSYPEYNEMYDIQYFLFDEVADQLYWLGNDTVWWEDIDYNENIGYFEFDTNATINGIRWIPDSSQYQLLIYINDTAIVNNRIYEDIQQVYSDRFTINNVGPNINVSRPAQLTFTNDQLDISLDIVIYGAELYNILFYFDINEKAYSTLSQRYYSQFEDPIGTYHYGLTTIIDLPDMTEGLHSITFIVEDVNGIQSRISIDYFYDLQNQAKILSHTPTFPSQSTPININYQYYNDYDKIALYVVYRETYGGRQGFRLLGELNGNQINGTFPIGMLPYGEYQFTMLIWDKAGNLAQDDYSLIVDEGGGLWQLSRSIQEIFMLLIGSTGIIVTVKSFRKQPDGFAEYQFTIPF